MRLTAAIKGDLRKQVANEWRVAGRAIRKGLREAGKGLQADLKRDAKGAGLGKLGNVWKVRVYQGRGGPTDSFAFVYPKGGERTRGAIWALDTGTTVRAKNGRYLTIPTNFNRKGGKRGGKVIYAIDQLHDTFVQKTREGHLLLFARVGRAQIKNAKTGRVQDRAFVNSQLLGSGRIKRTQEILKYGAVPMFILVPQVRISKRTNIDAMVSRWQARLPELIVKHWNNTNAR
jgi:hypothetical protein